MTKKKTTKKKTEKVSEESEEVQEEKPTKKGVKKYVSTKKYKDWESKWEFDPQDSHNNQPKPIPKMTKGLVSAIERGIVVEVEE